MYEDEGLESAYEDIHGGPQGHEQERNDAGSMHDPDEYSGELDWPDTGEFTD